jgi:NADH-quinone oxidoreductase subunit N
VFVDSQTVFHIWPEIVLVFLASWIYVGGAFQTSRTWWTIFSLAAYGVAAFIIWKNETGLWNQQSAASVQVVGPVIVDYLGFVLRLVAILIGALFTLVAAKIVRENLASEFFGTLMLLVVGIMLSTRANDLVLLFVGLELISIPTYVLLFLGRRDRITAEAAGKYFFLSIFSSAVLLYGISFLYGVTGTTVLMAPEGTPSIASTLTTMAMQQASPGLLSVAMVLVTAGLGFKIAAVPFHFYAPDVYEGASNGNAGLLAVAPKLGGLAALIRLLVIAMPDSSHLAWQLLLVITIASMTLGNICALWQKNMRRLMAYSSIAHAGYMLIGLTVAAGIPGNQSGGIAAAVLYVIVYTLASAGTFAALAYLGGSEREVNSLEDIAGLGKQKPLVAAAIAMCMFSLAGVPPLAGFWGKFSLFAGAIHAATSPPAAAGPSISVWMIILVVAGALNAAIAVAYYLRVVAVMYFATPQREHRAEGGWGAQVAMCAAALSVLLVGFFPSRFSSAARYADQSLARPMLSQTDSPAVGD